MGVIFFSLDLRLGVCLFCVCFFYFLFLCGVVVDGRVVSGVGFVEGGRRWGMEGVWVDRFGSGGFFNGFVFL